MSVWRAEIRDEIAVLACDQPDRRQNTLNAAALVDLDQFLTMAGQEYAEGRIRGLILASAKPESFIAGWDLAELEALPSAERGTELAQSGRRIVEKLADFELPTVAAIHGACLGPGLELALACMYRVVTLSPVTALGFSDILLNLPPALGGIERLVELVGTRTATELLLTGATLGPREAVQVQLADRATPPARLFETAAALLRGQPSTPTASAGPWPRWLEASAFKWTVLREVERQGRGAGLAALEVYPEISRLTQRWMETRLDDDDEVATLAATIFGRLVVGEESRALRSLTCLEGLQRGRRAGAGPGRPVQYAILQGVDPAFADLAWDLTGQRVAIRLRGRDQAAALAARKLFHEAAESALMENRVAPHLVRGQEGLVAAGVGTDGLGGADLALCLVGDDREAARNELLELEAHLPAAATLAVDDPGSGTDELIAALKFPARACGFSATPRGFGQRLVEISRGPATDDRVVSTLWDLALRLGRMPVLTRGRPGGFWRRVLAAWVFEALRLFEEGISPEAIDHVAESIGGPVGPLTFLEAWGAERFAALAALLERAHGERLKSPASLERLANEGLLDRAGRFGGKVRSELLKLVGIEVQEMPESIIEDRLYFASLGEALWCLDEQVVATPEDVDLASVHGLFFPRRRGGLITWAALLGFDEIRRRFEQLPAADVARLALPASLKDLLA